MTQLFPNFSQTSKPHKTIYGEIFKPNDAAWWSKEKATMVQFPIIYTSNRLFGDDQ